MINFKLKQLHEILPTGREPEQYLSWFWLTDGELWIRLGDDTVYEYTGEALAYFGDKESRYNDYYLVRFLEDFSDVFESIRRSIPPRFYQMTSDISRFRKDTDKWLQMNDDDDEDSERRFYFESYSQLMSWTNQRSFDSGHLIGGPLLSFYRCKDKIRIVWESTGVLENGTKIWTASNGAYEMEYVSFVQEVKRFGDAFFAAMDRQVDDAVAKEWGNIRVDKAGLVKEHDSRKEDFAKKLLLLQQDDQYHDQWNDLTALYDRMRREIATGNE